MVNPSFVNLVRFITQVSLVIAGASALWAFLFNSGIFYKSRAKEGKLCANILIPIFSISLILFLLGWWLSAWFLFPINSSAHEGIVQAETNFIQLGFQINLFWVSLLTITGLGGLFFYFSNRNREVVKKYLNIFFFSQLALISIILSLTTFAGEFNKLQFSFMLHNWHSIITLGTVVVVDYLFLRTISDDNLKRFLYPVYHTMSAFIWFGLGLEFLGSFLFFENTLEITSQFLFNQTAIAIIILNGALLSVRLNEALTNLVKPDKILKLKKTTAKILGISGSISIVSWFSVTFLDFFELPYSFLQFLSIYLVLILGVYLAKPIVERRFL